MPTTVPPGFVADASLRVWVVTSLANPAAPIVSSEINAGTTIDASCYLTNGFNPDANTATISDDRLCLAQVLEDMGTTTWSIDDIEYIYDVQNAASVSNKLYAGLPQGASVFLVARYGMSVDTAPAAGQKVDVFPVKVGPGRKLPPERNTKGRVRQKPFVNGVVQRDVALV
ncbi:hypothetical protein [Phycicoccus avicenniae]|uniref:phage tail tube protein n=1 Tax=Phycicoccus avicenniae TaxID=2828860 RepID=UPI003D2B573B